MLRIAHRGAKGYAPENTIAAFQKALDLGADGIELDVHLSADGHVVVIHDHTLDRTTDGTGEVASLTWDEIAKSRIDGIHKVPSLEQVLDLVGPGFLLNIELKVPDSGEAVLDILERCTAKGFSYDQFLISSFDWVALQDVRKRHPKIPLGVLTETDLELAIAFAHSIHAESIHTYFHLLDAEKVRRMQRNGYRVFAWTVNEPEDITRVKSYLADGIISDFPDRI